MAQNINRRPKGLQALLDSKNLGVNPSVLSETVAPTVDLSDMFYTDLVLEQANGTFAGTLGTVLTPGARITVPVGQTWAIKAWSAYCAPAGTVNLGISILLEPDIGGGFVIAASGDSGLANVLANQAITAERVFERPLILTGGNNLSAMLNRQSAASNWTIQHQVAYYRLDT